MPAPRSVAPTPNMAPFVAVLAIIVALVATWLRLPGAVVAVLGLTVAGWMSSPPPLTGKKDAAGYPSVGNPGEERALLRHRIWSHLKYRLLFPSTDWLINDRVQIRGFLERSEKVQQILPPKLSRFVGILKAAMVAAWLVVPTSFVTWAAIGAAAIVFTAPVDALAIWRVAPDTATWLMWPNAVAAYVLVKQVGASRRRFAAIEDPKPEVTVADLPVVTRERERHLFAVLVGATAIGAVAGTAAIVAINASGIGWLIAPPQLAAAGVAIAAAAMFLHSQCVPEAYTDWEHTVEARAEAKVRWETLKVDPAPYLVQHVRFGSDDQLPVRADTFDAPATLGAAGALAMAAKIAPAFGAGTKVTILNEPDLDGQEQPIPGSRHPLRFTVVSWPVDTTVDATSPDVDVELMKMSMRVTASNAAAARSYPAPMLLSVSPVFAPSTRAEETSLGPDVIGEGDPPGDERNSSTTEGLIGTGSTAAWFSEWAAPEYNAADLLPLIAFDIGAAVGGEAVADPGAGPVLYTGALTSGTTEFTDPGIAERFEVLAREAAWAPRWNDALPMGFQKPWIQSANYTHEKLPSGQVIECQPFMTGQGIPSETYITPELERKLQSTLGNAPFVSIIGWPLPGGRPGERHPGAFQVLWSSQHVPRNPAQIVPASSPTARGVKWEIAAAVNAGFDAAFLRGKTVKRAEVISATALTSRSSRGHIWDIALRLYDGITLMDVKNASEKIRLGMGAAPWMRIADHPEGVRIVIGAEPDGDGVSFARPRSRDIVTNLDWGQAFIDSKLASPVDGLPPQLDESSVLETNDQVDDLIFTIPRGLAITDFQEPKALDRMRVARAKTFIDVRHTSDPAKFRMLTCDIDPMPNPAPFMWDRMGPQKMRSTAFGTNVEGAAVEWDLDLDSHLLILGSNGSGKGMAATSMVTDMLMSGWDVYAADPNKGFNDFIFADPWLKARATTYPDTVAVVRKFLALLDERKELNRQHKVSNVKDLPDDVRPPMACLFLDEFTSLVIPDALTKLGDHATEQDQLEYAETVAINNAKATIGSGIGRLNREGRAVGLVMVLMGQKLTSNELKYIPGGATIKSQMSRLAMGKMSYGDMASAFNDAPSAMGLLGSSVPRGRGIFESTAQAAFTVQTWWAGGSATDHFRAMTEHIAAVREPLRPDELFDPAPFRPSSQSSSPIFGRVIDGADDVDDDEVIDLGIAADLDLSDFDFTELAPAGVTDGTADDLGSPPSPSPVPGAELPPIEGADSPPPAPAITRVDFVGPGAMSDAPGMIDVDELPAGDDQTGSPAVDAIISWVVRHPGVTEVTWSSPLAVEEDTIGLTHAELLVAAMSQRGITVSIESPSEKDLEGPTPSQGSPAPAPLSAAGPDPFNQPEPTPQRAPDDLFDGPRTNTVVLTDDLFD